MKKIIPTFVSLISVFLSFVAIKYALLGAFNISITMILLCVIIDFVDGFLARKLDAVSVFGGEVDSLCDSFAFGITPAICVYFWLLMTMNLFGVFICCMLICALIIRLARFNSFSIEKITEYNGIDLTKYFIGIPAPLFGVLILTPIAFADFVNINLCKNLTDELESCVYSFDRMRNSNLFCVIIFIYYTLISYLSISCVKIRSLKNFKPTLSIMILLLLILLFCIISYPVYTTIIVFILSFCYIAFSLLKTNETVD